MNERTTLRPSAEDRAALEHALSSWLSPIPPHRVVARLPGLSNRSFRVILEPRAALPRGADVVVRLPGPSPHVSVDRAIEARAARQAAGVGVGPAVRHADPASGVLVVDHVPGVRPVAAGDLGRPEVRCAVVSALAAFHSTSALGRELDPCAVLDDYRTSLGGAVGTPPAVYRLLDRAQRVADGLPGDAPKVPSHVDPTPGNVLLAGERVWLVDFEYAADADPLWDLAELASSRDLDPERARELLEASDLTATDDAAFARRRAVCDAIAGAWGLVTGNASTARERLGACARGLDALGIRDSRAT